MGLKDALKIPPPKPPLREVRGWIFGEIETQESRLRTARWEGASAMWREFVTALHGD